MNTVAVRTGLPAMIRHITRKMLLGKRIIIAGFIGLFIALILGYAGSQPYYYENPVDIGTDMMDLLILFFFMPIIAMIYGTSIVRDDIDDKSITPVVTSPIGRFPAYMGYYLSLAITLSIVMLGITSIGFVAFFGQTGGDGMGNLYVSMCGLVIIGSFAYSTLFLALSVALEKPMYMGLFYAFIWEGFIGSIPGSIGKLSIKYYLRSLGSEWIGHGSISRFRGIEGADAFLVLLLVAFIFLFIGGKLFEEKEIP